MRSFLAAAASIALAAIFATAVSFAADAPAEPVLKAAQRILVLGDSITHAGGYVELVDAAIVTAYPDRRYTFINIGLPSETITGLSEPYHPFPRPDVHERLGRALAKIKPDVVIACYGMNDGIYHPFGEERFAAYKAGVDKLVADCRAAGAQVVLVTPPPFDPQPVRGKLRAADAKEFGYKDVYEHYDRDVLARYAAWIVERGKRDDVLAAVDIHTPINAHLAERRKDEPGYRMSGDGIHPDRQGHAAIARHLLLGLGFPDAAAAIEGIDGGLLNLVAQRQRVLRDAWLGEVGHQRPGMKPGKPVAEAEREAADLTAQIDALRR